MNENSTAQQWEPPNDYFGYRGSVTESWVCIDCGFNTAPGFTPRAEMERRMLYGHESSVNQTIGPDSEVYMVRASVWKKTGLEEWGQCLCIGCLERRIGRRLKPKDFTGHVFNEMPGTARLLSRRWGVSEAQVEKLLRAAS